MTTDLPVEDGDPPGLEAIVLAAGAGRRFGGGKLMAPWRGGALVDGALSAAFAAPARRVIVVTGADPRVEGAALRFAERLGQVARLRLVHAPDHADGMAATLKAGIRATRADCAGAFVFLGDMPLIPTSVLRPLADRLAAGDRAAAPTCGGRRGHPVVFAASLFPDLLALSGDEGARALIRRLGAAVGAVETEDEGVLLDVDTPDALPG